MGNGSIVGDRTSSSELCVLVPLGAEKLCFPVGGKTSDIASCGVDLSMSDDGSTRCDPTPKTECEGGVSSAQSMMEDRPFAPNELSSPGATGSRSKGLERQDFESFAGLAWVKNTNTDDNVISSDTGNASTYRKCSTKQGDGSFF